MNQQKSIFQWIKNKNESKTVNGPKRAKGRAIFHKRVRDQQKTNMNQKRKNLVITEQMNNITKINGPKRAEGRAIQYSKAVIKSKKRIGKNTGKSHEMK